MARNEPFIIKMGLEDLITPGLTKINKQLAALNAPTKRMQTQLSKFADATGINKVVGALTDLGRKAVGAFLSVAQLIPALGALTGAASVAGMGALVKQFADWGNQIARNAALLNTTPGKLTELENAAQLAGANVGSMTQGMIAFRQALNDTVLHGGATDLGKQFATIGLDWTKMREEMDKDPTAAFAHYADALQKKYTDLQQRMHEAGVAGFTPDTQRMFTELSQLQGRLEQARANAGPNVDEQAKNAQRLQEQFASVTQAAQGMAREVVSAISPIVEHWLKDITTWLDDPKNRQWLSEEAKEGLGWIDRTLRSIKEWLDKTEMGNFRKDWEAIASAATAFADAINKVSSGLSAVMHLTVGAGGYLGHTLSGRDTSGDVDHLNKALGDGRVATGAPREGTAEPSWFSKLGGWMGRNYSTEGTEFGGGSPASSDDLRRRLGTPDENAKKTGEQVSQNLDKTWQDSAADSIKNALRELFGIKSAQGSEMGLPEVGPHRDTAALSSAEQVARAQQARSVFRGAGYTDQQSIGLVANLVKESGLRAGAVGDGGVAHGIAQWHPDRVKAILGGTGIDVRTASYEDQLKAVVWELSHNEKAAGDQLRGATTYGSAGSIVSRAYERPKAVQAEMLERGMAAEDWHRRLGDRPIVSMPGAANSNTPGSSINGTINTEITVKAPPGFTIRSSSSASGANLSPPRTNSVMTGTN